MRTGAHPDYKEVVFFDTSCDYKFLTRSTMETKGKETIKWTDGKEYPLVKIEVSSESHPFYTGKHKIVDTAGRVEKFRQRYARKSTTDTPAAGKPDAPDTSAAKKPAAPDTSAAKKPAAPDTSAAKKPAATDKHAEKKPAAK